MEARNGVGNFKADIEEVNSRIQGASRDEHIHHSCRWTRYNQQRNIGTSTLEALSPLFTHRAYATRRARLGEKKVPWLLRMEAAIRDLLFKSRLHELAGRPREYRIS